ncbi:MAG: hypothetical protein M3463_09620, partial [Verrucomicrobiota bacterium]|nr:hypothetical protein [Verrucomicrobiota bacterium]
MALILLLHLSVLSSLAAEPGRKFRAGAATSNITPRLGISINGSMADRKAGHIHDELHARCLVLDDGQTTLAIAVCDSVAISREVVDEAKRIASEASGIPVDHILVSATHSHSCGAATSVFSSDADPEYQKFLSLRIADGIRRARNNLELARIGWASGSVPGQVFNRRWRMRPGVPLPNPLGGFDQVKMNPGIGNPNLLEPAGPTDPAVPLISVQSPEGRPIALLANYSLHYVGGTGPGHISADYFSAFCDRLQELLQADRLDPPFVPMMSNGASGDINNINFRAPAPKRKPYEKIREVADEVATEVLRVCKSLEYRDWVPLGARRQELTLGVRRPDRAELDRAREILAAADGRALNGPHEVYAHETVLMSEYPPQVPVIVQA